MMEGPERLRPFPFGQHAGEWAVLPKFDSARRAGGEQIQQDLDWSIEQSLPSVEVGSNTAEGMNLTKARQIPASLRKDMQRIQGKLACNRPVQPQTPLLVASQCKPTPSDRLEIATLNAAVHPCHLVAEPSAAA